LLLLCIGIAFFALAARRKAGHTRNLALALIAPFLLEVAIFFVLGLLAHKNFWPRHLNMAFPFYVAALGVALNSSLQFGNSLAKASTVLLAALLLWSSLRLRYSAAYAKEDYRWATAQALRVSQQGHLVWWAANKDAGRCYGLRLVTSKPGKGEAFSTHVAQDAGIMADPDNGALPDDIFLSRPDVHDLDGVVIRLVRNHGYHLKATHRAFEWWVK